jgi:hypothetical protein
VHLISAEKLKQVETKYPDMTATIQSFCKTIEPGVSLLDLNTFLTDYGYRPVIFYTDYMQWNPYRVNFNVLYCNLNSTWYTEGEKIYDESWYGNKTKSNSQ